MIKKFHFIFFFPDEKDVNLMNTMTVSLSSKKKIKGRHFTKNLFSNMHYISVMSAIQTHPDFEFFFYSNIEPAGEYWEKLEGKVK